MAVQNPVLDRAALDALFREARTHNVWLDKPVEDAVLRQLYELAKMAPTAMNSQPVRLVFVKSREAKERLKPCLSPGNVDKTMGAPATVIVAWDTEFHEKMPKLFPARDVKTQLAGQPAEVRHKMALMNATLQGGYLILAARALGLDCGPMAGFDNAKVDAAFFPDGKWKSNFLLNLGYGDPSKLFPRNPRLDFDEACRID
ncbi:malonic semialdehyde reductase [Archangium violaceum]|uniref:malonic semialdehyde reductase n=1 Tax=Archangium violaceum TaxID=83451 RepID=UPI00193BAB7A|nr:malonic semialdehyde reductase [Archangium violaceum]QRK11010.1 malonic semialdehyde reductase [Archangium violaceum]